MLLAVWLLYVEVIVVVVVDDLLLSGWLFGGSVRTAFFWCVCKQNSEFTCPVTRPKPRSEILMHCVLQIASYVPADICGCWERRLTL